MVLALPDGKWHWIITKKTGDTTTTEKSEDVKYRVVHSAHTEKKKDAVDPEKRMNYNEC